LAVVTNDASVMR